MNASNLMSEQFVLEIKALSLQGVGLIDVGERERERRGGI